MKDRIVLVNDDETTMLVAAFVVESFYPDWRLESYTDPLTAYQVLAIAPPDVLVTDLHLAMVSGAELILWARKRYPDMPVVVLSALPRAEVEAQLGSLDGIEVVEKPWKPEELFRRIERVLAAAWGAGPEIPSRFDALPAAGSALDRAASRFRQMPAAVSPQAGVTLVSLTEERILTLQGAPPEAPPAALCLWIDDLIASAASDEADFGQLEEIRKDQGWVVAWSRPAGLAAVIAQDLGTAADAFAFRAAAGQTLDRLF